MEIAVLGSGSVGGTVGRTWAQAGHRIHFGVRAPERKAQGAEALLELGVFFEPVGEALQGVEVVLFAVPSAAVPALAEDHASQLDGKILLDATNDFSAERMGRVRELREAAPTAHIFRAFNSLGWENFDAPDFGGLRADLFYCGPAGEAATAAVEGLIEDAGLRPIRLGDLDKEHLLDGFTRIWATLAIEGKRGRHLAFKMLT